MQSDLKATLLSLVVFSLAAAPAQAQTGTTAISSDVLTRYTVVEGDNLSSIASQRTVYGDLRLWPLIYKGNTDELDDPNAVQSGQVLIIPRNLSESAIEAAIAYGEKRRELVNRLNALDLEYLHDQ